MCYCNMLTRVGGKEIAGNDRARKFKFDTCEHHCSFPLQERQRNQGEGATGSGSDESSSVHTKTELTAEKVLCTVTIHGVTNNHI